jgi:hypothetical protein
MLYTKESVREKLLVNNNWLKRAVLRLTKLQTEFEVTNKVTKDNNKVGFNASDAKFLTDINNIIIKSPNKELEEILTPKQIYFTRKRMLKYSGQLAKIANGKI